MSVMDDDHDGDHEDHDDDEEDVEDVDDGAASLEDVIATLLVDLSRLCAVMLLSSCFSLFRSLVLM